MGKQFQPRIRRSYRSMTPAKFYSFNQRVRKRLSEPSNIAESAWAANTTLLSSYLSTSDKHAEVYHEAGYGSRLVISAREILQAQLIVNLDEIASVLEAESVRNPEVLLVSGFDLTKERRSSARAKEIVPVSEEAKVNAAQLA